MLNTGPRPWRPSGSDAGFALIIVLWSLVLVSLLVTQLISDGRLEMRRVSNGRAAVTRQAVADGAIDEMVFHLLDHSDHHWAADGAQHELRFGDSVVSVSATNEADRIDPNVAPAPLLAALLHRVGLAERDASQIADAIVDWRTQTGDSSVRAAAYRPMGYLPPGTPFQTIEEIGLVAGMTPDILTRLSPHLQLFRALPPISATGDTIVKAALAEWSGLPPSTSGSALDENFVAITAVAQGADGNRASRQAVVQLDLAGRGMPFHVLAWR